MKLKTAAEDYSDQRDEASSRSLNAQRHGAYGDLNRVKSNEPIPEGLALVESQVHEELLEGGALNLLRANVIRLQTAADLLWGYMARSSDRFHSGLKACGWLSNSAIRALEKLSQLERDTAKNELDLVVAMSEPVEDGSERQDDYH